MEQRFQAPKNWTDMFFENRRGHKIRYGYIFPKNAKALISINVGLSEFCEKYFEVIHDLLDRGFAISIHDWMGQGLSDRYLANPHKRHIGTFQDDIDDYLDLMNQHIIPKVNAQYGDDFPRILLAHSMGGHLSLRALLQSSDFVMQGLFLSAPLLQIRATAYLPDILSIPLLKTLNTYYHRQYVPGGDNWAPRGSYGKSLFSSDPIRDEVFDMYCTENSSLQIGSPTIGWVYEATLSCQRLQEMDILSLKCPIYAILAKNDRLVDNKATRIFLDKIPHAQYETISPARHELMMERDSVRDLFFKYFDEFTGQILKS